MGSFAADFLRHPCSYGRELFPLCVRYATIFATGSVAGRRTARPYKQYNGSSWGEPLARPCGTPLPRLGATKLRWSTVSIGRTSGE